MAAFRRSPNELKKQTKKKKNTDKNSRKVYYKLHNTKKRPHFHDKNRLPPPLSTHTHTPKIGKFRRKIYRNNEPTQMAFFLFSFIAREPLPKKRSAQLD
jgi:hypothetical protein